MCSTLFSECCCPHWFIQSHFHRCMLSWSGENVLSQTSAVFFLFVWNNMCFVGLGNTAKGLGNFSANTRKSIEVKTVTILYLQHCILLNECLIHLIFHTLCVVSLGRSTNSQNTCWNARFCKPLCLKLPIICYSVCYFLRIFHRKMKVRFTSQRKPVSHSSYLIPHRALGSWSGRVEGTSAL